MIDKVELLQDIIESSKEYKFQDNILHIAKCYGNGESINVNMIGLIEIMYEKLDSEDIDRILLTDEEKESR